MTIVLSKRSAAAIQAIRLPFFILGYPNRSTASSITQRQFKRLKELAKLDTDDFTGQKHSLYSVRHTVICMRIILSEGQVNIFSLVKNAGTSVDQIERFYVRNLPLSGELTKSLQSFGSSLLPWLCRNKERPMRVQYTVIATLVLLCSQLSTTLADCSTVPFRFRIESNPVLTTNGVTDGGPCSHVFTSKTIIYEKSNIEKQAKLSKVGIWQGPFMEPKEYRKKAKKTKK